MNQKIVLVVLLGLAMAIWLIPLVAAMYFEEKERKNRGELSQKALYDERQTILRLKASQWALSSLMVYLSVWAVLHLGGWFDWTSATVELIFCGLVIVLTVRQMYCILHDAAIGWNQKKEATLSHIIMYFCSGFLILTRGEGVEGAAAVVVYFTALCMVVMAVATLYANHRRKKSDHSVKHS